MSNNEHHELQHERHHEHNHEHVHNQGHHEHDHEHEHTHVHEHSHEHDHEHAHNHEHHDATAYTAAVITVSDLGYAGRREDTSGPALVEMLKADGYIIIGTEIVPDDKNLIMAALLKYTDELNANLVLTTGGTGFSPRDITPEAALSIIQRQTPGIPELMRSESMKITPHGCLSRSVAGIRGRSLIITLPGSRKASTENYDAARPAIPHGLKMLMSEGSAECAAKAAQEVVLPNSHQTKEELDSPESLHTSDCSSGSAESLHVPSIDEWMHDAASAPNSDKCGMYLSHRGVVRSTSRGEEREGKPHREVMGMEFSYDAAKVEAAKTSCLAIEGIHYVRVWLNTGTLEIGDVIMQVLVGGSIRPVVISALESLVDELKNECVIEKEIF